MIVVILICFFLSDFDVIFVAVRQTYISGLIRIMFGMYCGLPMNVKIVCSIKYFVYKVHNLRKK